MTAETLITYLNDHWAGSAAGLASVEHLASKAETDEDRRFYATLRDEIAADRETLQEMIHTVGGDTSAVREMGGWLAERVSRLKLAFDDDGTGGLAQFEMIEILMLGVHGKQALWQALHAAQPGIAAIAHVDFARLARRAGDQRDRLEARRLEEARLVLRDAA